MRPIRLQHGLLPLIARPNDAFFACAFSANAEYDLAAVLSWAVEIAPRYGTDRTAWVSADVVSVVAQIITVAAPLDTVTDTVDSELTLADVVGLGPCAWSMTAYGAEDAFLWRVQGALDFVDGLELPSDGSSGIGSPISIDLGEGVTIALTILGNTADGGGTVDNAAVNAAIADSPSTTRTALGLGSAALSATGDFDASGAAAAVAASLAAHLSDTTDVHALASLDTAVTGAELDADHTKLAGIETAATADQTAIEIRTAYESERTAMGQAEAEALVATTVRLMTAQILAWAIDSRIAALVNSAPANLDTLGELATQLEDQDDAVAAIITSLAGKQSLDATLTALAALTTATDKLIYATGVDTFDTADFPAQARTLLAATTQALQRTALGLGTGDIATLLGLVLTPATNTSAITVTGLINGSSSQALATLSGTYNTSGTPKGFIIDILNTLSNAASSALTVRVGGSPILEVRPVDGYWGYPGLYTGQSGFTMISPHSKIGFAMGGALASIVGTGVALKLSSTTDMIYLGSLAASSDFSVGLAVTANDVLEQRRLTNPQTWRLFGTYTSATNYERFFIKAVAASSFVFGTEKGSGGGTARGLDIQTDGTTRLSIHATTGAVSLTGSLTTAGASKVTPVALAALVTAVDAGDGATANINDALAPVLGAVAVGGGSEKVTVRSNGTSWLVDSVPAPVTRINAQTGTSYTLVLADAGKLVTMDNGSASTWTIPTNAAVAFPVNTEIAGAQLGAGTVTIDGSGVTLRSVGGLLAASAQYASWCAVKIATDEWLVTGQLA